MKILYSLSHPSDRLDVERAGHIIRANAILKGLAGQGHEIIRMEAAGERRTRVAVQAYRQGLRKLLPRSIALRMRDLGRIVHGRRHGERLVEESRKHSFDLILETHLAFCLAGTVASRVTGIPLVIDDVAPAWEEQRQYGVGLRRTADRVFQKVSAQAALLIAVNGAMTTHLKARGVPDQKIALVENGYDEGLFHPGIDGRALRRQLGILGHEVVIVFVGSFQAFHRVDQLLQAYARVRAEQPSRLLLIGDGERAPKARCLAERLGTSDRVIFVGRVPHSQIPDYIAAGDIAVIPATNDYGNPMKLYEYLAMGKAVVAPDQDTITETVAHGKSAFLFERGSIATMAEALCALIRDADLRRALGASGRACVRNCTWERRAQAMHRVFVDARFGSA